MGAGQALSDSNAAGHGCVVNGVSVGDSNFGFTQAECTAQSGSWDPYNCQTAAGYWSPSIAYSTELAEAWQPQCCSVPTPTPIPTTAMPTTPIPTSPPGPCPAQCRIPICAGLGTDGPGWNNNWQGVPDDQPTINGLCTHYCKDYAAGKYLCGDGAWHQSGVDCRECGTSFVPAPAPASPSSGLCKTSNISAHRACV